MPGKPRIANVIIDLPVRELDRVFDYIIPYELSGVVVGSIVIVPFGNTKQVGYVIGLDDFSEHEQLAEIEQLVHEKPVFNEQTVELSRWIADYYLSTLNDALKLSLPPGFSSRIKQKIKLVAENPDPVKLANSPRRLEVIEIIRGLGGSATLDTIKAAYSGPDITGIIRRLERSGLVERFYELEKPKAKERVVRYASLAIGNMAMDMPVFVVEQSLPSGEDSAISTCGVKKAQCEVQEAYTDMMAMLNRAPKQQKLVEMLAKHGPQPTTVLLAATGATHSTLNSLVKRGHIAISERSEEREPIAHFTHIDEAVTLTGEQEKSLESINAAIDHTSEDVFLLQGVTGSGKTEIYLQAIRNVLNHDKGAIVLVPEIALTAQAVARFKARFGSNIAVLHSALGAGERFDQWRGILEGTYRVVVGARSAVFAPVQNLGLIVVDEEHEGSYKQGRNPRYHARDVAIERARIEKAVTVLGSATPSLEVKRRAETGSYRPLYLRKRVKDRQLPRIELIDMREEPYKKDKSMFSSLLKMRLDETLESGGKAILFLNRRGFSNFILCQDCGFVPKCRSCAVSLTYHTTNHSIRCHHCNFVTKAPAICPKCAGNQLSYPGIGTQRVEIELAQLYPDVPVIRMDADTTGSKGSHQRWLANFKAEPKAILLGTQMIAKGLDFPEVTLVGVINADTSLHLPDFHAGEHTFQILMQVAGRSGRGEEPGRVVIQTYSPNSYPIQAVLVGDYDSFYKSEVDFREELGYPPFSSLIRLIFSGREHPVVSGLAKRAAKGLLDSGILESTELVGPSPAPLLRVKGDYRWHILLKTTDSLTVKKFLVDNFARFIPEKYRSVVSLSIDVDPVFLL